MRNAFLPLLMFLPVVLVAEEVSPTVAGRVSVTNDLIFTAPEKTILWKTVFSESFDVPVDWPNGAAYAQLTVSAAGTVLKTYRVEPPADCQNVILSFPNDERSERVLDLSLVFYSSSDEALEEGACTASLGLVRGTNGRTARFVAGGESGKDWTCFTERSRVVPIGEDISSPRIDGVDIPAVSVPGWHFWNAIAIGSYTLSAERNGVAWLGEFERHPDGMTVLFR